MPESSNTQDHTIPGYLSEDNKRRFTITAGLVAAGVLIAQFALPFAMMVALIATGPGWVGDFSRIDPAHLTIFDGDYWYIRTQYGSGSKPDTSTLIRAGKDFEEPEEIVKTDEDTSLLPVGDRLWLIAKKSIGYVQNGQYTAIDQAKPLAEFSRPFEFERQPAVLERWPDGLVLEVHDGIKWQTRGALDIVLPDSECGCGLSWARAVSDDTALHVFLQFGSTVYYGQWLPDDQERIAWERAADSGEGWSPALSDGHPFVLSLMRGAKGNQLVVTHRTDDGWTEYLRTGSYRGDSVATLPPRSNDTVTAVVGSSYASSVTMVDIGEHLDTRETILGKDSNEAPEFFPKQIMWFMGLQYGVTFLLPVILALILTALMRRHRIATYQGADRPANFATLISRAIAQVVDLVIIIGPLAFVGWYFFHKNFLNSATQPEGFWEVVAFISPALLGLSWILLVIVVFSYLEGRFGITPGKWLAKIRVLGTDLQPCGFGRALLRNLLKCVDGFFNFIVGIVVVALSENWQRVGDMAARTVVVSVKSNPDNPIDPGGTTNA